MHSRLCDIYNMRQKLDRENVREDVGGMIESGYYGRRFEDHKNKIELYSNQVKFFYF
jgi:hypothetical protein